MFGSVGTAGAPPGLLGLELGQVALQVLGREPRVLLANVGDALADPSDLGLELVIREHAVPLRGR